MNIKEYVSSLPYDQVKFLHSLSLKDLFSGVSVLDLEFLKAMLGVFGAICYLTTAKEYRKQHNLEGTVFVDAKTIKEISELDHVKFMELYANGLAEFLNDENSSFPIRYIEWVKNEKVSFARSKPTSPGGTFSRSANDDQREELERAYIENSFERTSIDDRHMDSNQLASFRDVVDRVVSDIMSIYGQFLDDPSKPVALQKRLSNFAGKEDKIKLVVTIARPLPFALSACETDSLESNDSRIKLGALKLFCLETIATLGRKLGLEERPDAVIDGFDPGLTRSIKLRGAVRVTEQLAALQWYIPLSKEAAIYFQVALVVANPPPSLFHDNVVFRQAPKHKE